MSLSKKISGFLYLMFFAFAGQATDIKLPSVFKVSDQQLVLNGYGVRHKAVFDLYVGGLYLKEKSRDAHKIIKANEPMAIKIDVISNLITSKRLEEGMRSEFKRIGGNLEPFNDRIELLVKAFKEDVKIGDTFDLIYEPASGLKIYKNDQLFSTIPGLDFKQLVFATWFGEDPTDENLKQGMLGVKRVKL